MAVARLCSQHAVQTSTAPDGRGHSGLAVPVALLKTRHRGPPLALTWPHHSILNYFNKSNSYIDIYYRPTKMNRRNVAVVPVI